MVGIVNLAANPDSIVGYEVSRLVEVAVSGAHKEPLARPATRPNVSNPFHVAFSG